MALENIGEDSSREALSKAELFLGGQDDAEGLQVLGYVQELKTYQIMYSLLGGINFSVDSGKKRTINCCQFVIR